MAVNRKFSGRFRARRRAGMAFTQHFPFESLPTLSPPCQILKAPDEATEKKWTAEARKSTSMRPFTLSTPFNPCTSRCPGVHAVRTSCKEVVRLSELQESAYMANHRQAARQAVLTAARQAPKPAAPPAAGSAAAAAGSQAAAPAAGRQVTVVQHQQHPHQRPPSQMTVNQMVAQHQVSRVACLHVQPCAGRMDALHGWTSIELSHQTSRLCTP